jgi:hypothetical protein
MAELAHKAAGPVGRGGSVGHQQRMLAGLPLDSHNALNDRDFLSQVSRSGLLRSGVRSSCLSLFRLVDEGPGMRLLEGAGRL